VKPFQFINAPSVCIEIGQSSLKALVADPDKGLELPLERLENGRLSPSCRERLTLRLREWLKRRNWQPRQRAWCAINARGVSVRRLSLPSCSREELQRLLLLQIEREFPLPPDELAWGYRQLNAERLPDNGAPVTRELLVVALKREVIEEYSQLLAGCGLSPLFTLGGLARHALCLQPPASYAQLDIGRSHSELISFDHDVPGSIRILPWGGEDITRSIERRLALKRDEAEKLKIQSGHETNQLPLQQIEVAIVVEVESLAALIRSQEVGQKLYLSGESARLKDFAPRLAKAIGGSMECERMDVPPGPGRSAATLGLKSAGGKNGEGTPLVLQFNRSAGRESLLRPGPWKWAALAVLLALGSLSLRYAEAIFYQPRLSRRLAEVKIEREKLPQIERELAFLQYLKANQPPYLDAISMIATSAPGTRVESLSMNRRGDLSLRGSMRDSQQVLDFRSKLIDSGFFASVTVEEQTPSPNGQSVAVRIAAQWKPTGERKPLPSEPARQQPEKSKIPAKDIPSATSTNMATASAKATSPPDK